MDPRIDVIWLRPETGSRGPKATYTRDDVAETAVRIADEEGIGAVTMRRIATELEVGVASLYRYVRKKEELLELMLDAVMAELAPPEPTGDWRADLRELAYRQRELWLRHPWFLGVAVRPTLGPNSLRWAEGALALFDGLGFTPDELVLGMGTVTSFVYGHMLGEVTEAEAARQGGLTHEEWMAKQSPYGPVIIESGLYPRVSRVMVEASLPHAANRHERAFAWGLDQVIAGLAAKLPSGH